MTKTLVSWLAFNNDFENGEVSTNGPTYLFHQNFYADYECHIILSSKEDDDIRAEKLQNKLGNDFPDHHVEIKYMDIISVINLGEIKPKVEKFLLSLGTKDIDIFFSPGTSIMQVTWYICHTTLGLNTRLLQTIPKSKSKSGESVLLNIETSFSSIPVSAVIKQQQLEAKQSKTHSDFELTDSLKPIYESAYRIAQTDVTTFIQGESGTGKEHLAKHIHKNSIRKDKPYFTVNCSALGDQLLESRLFGYIKGSFTGAEKDTLGIFDLANKGTVFLDEIGDISSYMQQLLLRILQEKEIQPIGSTPKKVDVRIISATNKNLIDLCKVGNFRWDLYYRLVVAELELPPLYERGQEEISQMINFFLRSKKAIFRRKRMLSLNKEVRLFLLNYSYPGNVRELENIIETLYVHSDDEVIIGNLPKRLLASNEQNSLNWKAVEKQLIEKVLKSTRGNKAQAQKILGYGSINTLGKKSTEYDRTT